MPSYHRVDRGVWRRGGGGATPRANRLASAAPTTTPRLPWAPPPSARHARRWRAPLPAPHGPVHGRHRTDAAKRPLRAARRRARSPPPACSGPVRARAVRRTPLRVPCLAATAAGPAAATPRWPRSCPAARRRRWRYGKPAARAAARPRSAPARRLAAQRATRQARPQAAMRSGAAPATASAGSDKARAAAGGAGRAGTCRNARRVGRPATGSASSSGVAIAGPRRLNTVTANCRCATGSSARRSGAGDDCARANAGRSANSGQRLSCAARCSRRNALASAAAGARSSCWPPQHRRTRTRTQALLGGPGRIGQRAGRDEHQASERPAERMQCRRVRHERRRDAQQAAGGSEPLRQERREQAQFAAAGSGQQQFGQPGGRPAAAGQLGVERGKTGRCARPLSLRPAARRSASHSAGRSAAGRPSSTCVARKGEEGASLCIAGGWTIAVYLYSYCGGLHQGSTGHFLQDGRPATSLQRGPCGWACTRARSKPSARNLAVTAASSADVSAGCRASTHRYSREASLTMA